MSDLDTALRCLAERGSPVGSERLRERVAMELAGARSGSRAAMIPRWAIVAVAAVATIVLVGGPIALVRRSGGSVASRQVAQSTTLPPSSRAASGVATTVTDGSPPIGAWSPILSTTRAKIPPAATTCPPGTTPDIPGPPDQGRPAEGPWSNQAAVFDTHAGRIVFVDEVADTWTFDVCTNTWQRMEPEGSPYGGGEEAGELVYDIDSDRTISFGSNGVSVYDANRNSWSNRPLPPDVDYFFDGLGAVYDPSSGLVLVVTGDGLCVAYDVDTDRWTEVGAVVEVRDVTFEAQTQEAGPPFLIGYMSAADRLAFLGFDGAPFQDQGKLLNPRTGEAAPLEPPEGGVWGGFGAFRYATGGETAYTFGEGVCRLDPVTLDWECNEVGLQAEGPSAMVYDSINDRLVVINNHCCNWPGRTVTDGVYAIDFERSERMELLATANIRTETDGS